MPNTSPGLRQAQILDWLRAEHLMQIDQIVERLGVSLMTVHRDLDQLVREGMAEKAHGSVRLPRERSAEAVTTICRLCGGSLPERTRVILQRGESVHSACCPHCGVLMLEQLGPDVISLASDFLYGRMVNMRQAVYLVNSEIAPCCLPGVLCFASARDAAQFQRGFGGDILSFDAVRQFLQDGHLPGHCHSGG